MLLPRHPFRKLNVECLEDASRAIILQKPINNFSFLADNPPRHVAEWEEQRWRQLGVEAAAASGRQCAREECMWKRDSRNPNAVHGLRSCKIEIALTISCQFAILIIFTSVLNKNKNELLTSDFFNVEYKTVGLFGDEAPLDDDMIFYIRSNCDDINNG